MRVLRFILQKEFLQIFRNRFMLPIIFVMPVVQLIVLTYAADFEIENIQLTLIDQDHSQASAELTGKFVASSKFIVQTANTGFDEGMKLLDNGKADVVIRIPAGFERDLYRHEDPSLMLDVDAIDGQAASLSYFYALSIITDYNLRDAVKFNDNGPGILPLGIEPRFWYNEEMRYSNLMVPGLLVVLVTMLGMFLSAMNIVREKEIGTLEQLNVTPITRTQFIIGKLFPFWVIGMGELAIGLALGRVLFNIPILGHPALLFAFAAIYLPVMLGIGLIISTIAKTQQQAMFLSWFFIVIFILMGGLFTSIDNMPQWAQDITKANPVAYFIEVIRMVLLKGSNFNDISRNFVIVGLFAIGVNVIAVRMYHKRG